MLKSDTKLQQWYATYLRSDGTRARRSIFYVAPGDSVPILENESADILRVRTPSMILPMCHDHYTANADTQATPVISRFRLRLLFNVIRVVGCLWGIGYELQYDGQGNIVTTEVAVNMMAGENVLGLSDYEPGSIDPARVASEEYKEAATRLIPYMEALGLSKFNIHWEDGTLYVDHPILRRADTPRQEEQPAVPENAETVPDSAENAGIFTENRDSGMESVPEAGVPVGNVQQDVDDGFIPFDPDVKPGENGVISIPSPGTAGVDAMSAPEQPKPSALSRIPTDRSGEPVYEQAEPDIAWDALVEQTEGDEDIARSVIEQTISEKEEELKKMSKQKPKAGLSTSQKIKAEKDKKIAMDGIQQSIDHWKRMAGTKQRRQAEEDAIRRAEMRKRAEEARVKAEQERAGREEAERMEREALNGVPDWSRDTPQDARARGYRRNGPQKVDRQEPLASGGEPSLRSGHNVLTGKEVEVRFGENELPKGHAAIIDAAVLQPSHMEGMRNPRHYLDEAQPKERTDAPSREAARKIASDIRPEEITSSVTAYTGAPTVNSRGEAIQGNSRAAALRLMYDENPEQAAKYRQYLIDHAADYGLTPEQIASVEHPVLVNMLDVADDEAIRLGQFVAQDTESGGIERIKPKNAVQKMGDKIRNFANILLRSEDDEASLSQLIETNGTETLKWMSRNGFITDTQYGSAFDSKGELSAKASEDLKGILYQSIFTGGSTRLEEMFNRLPAKAQRGILATAFRDNDSRREDRITGEVQQSIIAFYDMMSSEAFSSATNLKEAMAAAEAWRRQYAFDDVSGKTYLPAENFSNFALKLAAIYKGGSQKFIQQTFNDLFDTIQGTAQDTLFEEADKTPRSLAEAIGKVLDLEYQPVRQNDNGNNGSDAVDVNTPQGETGGPRSDGDAEIGEREPGSAEPADSGAGTEGYVGLSGNIWNGEQTEASAPEEKRTKESLLPNSSEWLLAEHPADVPDLLPTQGKSDVGKDAATRGTAGQPNAEARAVAPDLSVGKDNTSPADKQAEGDERYFGPDSAEEREAAIEAEEDALRSRIEVKDDDWAEGGGYTPTLKRTVVIDGTHNVTQIDAPDDKGDYTGSVYEYDGKTFGDLREVIDHIDGNTVCPVCGKSHIPNYRNQDVMCPQCGSDLSVFRQIDQLSDEKAQKTLANINQMEEEFGVTIGKQQFDRTVPSTAQEQKSAIARIVDFAKKVKNRLERAVIGGITARQRRDFAEQGIEGVDETWVHSFESSAVSHNQKHHGNAKREEKRGQMAITPEDYARIPEILERYDKVTKSPNKTKGTENDVIIYEKDFEDGYVYYLEEKRDNRKSLAFHTMYKKKKGTDSSDGFAVKPTAPITPVAPSDNLSSNYKGKDNTLLSDKQTDDEIREDEDVFSRMERMARNETLRTNIRDAEGEVNTEPTDRQKEAGNYKKGHVQVGAFDVTIENPKGSVVYQQFFRKILIDIFVCVKFYC